LRANGSGERPRDDRLREAIQGSKQELDCFVASLLAMMNESPLPSIEASYLLALKNSRSSVAASLSPTAE
jgi:hypothetical protein